MHIQQLNYRIYCHNIRYDNHHPAPGEKSWATRKVDSVASMRFHSEHNNAIICLQEVLHNQLLDILAGLNNTGDEWDYFGVGRDDGEEAGEYAPVLFKKSEWQLVKGRTWWLSETPDEPSRGWDAALPRIMTFARLKHHDTGREIGVFNTHYDHAGKTARRESSKLIMEKMKTEMGDLPVTLCGDFNSERSDDAYHTLNQGLQDTGLYFPEDQRYGHTLTFAGFNETPKYIDFIWFPGNVNLKPASFGICENKFHGFQFSDHRPVIADFVAN